MKNPETIKYVVGFALNEARTHVCLIRKTRPSWQCGYLNGIGGKVEPGETTHEAMVREFLEETGVEIPEWVAGPYLAGGLPDHPYSVHCYYAATDLIHKTKTTTDEEGVVVPVADLFGLRTQMNEYQKAIAPSVVLDDRNPLITLAMGLNEEVGELNKIVFKKWRYAGQATPEGFNPEQFEEVRGELSDILWYVAATAREFGMTLESVGQCNLDKLQRRRENNHPKSVFSNKEKDESSDKLQEAEHPGLHRPGRCFGRLRHPGGPVRVQAPRGGRSADTGLLFGHQAPPGGRGVR
jgi:8-oxo-dGTP pyrophosphatase MutT (NUDIX family)/NTP pyrophosphatase (non-canonical NTP hydrolase)